MSAFAGIVVFGETPIDAGLVARLTSIVGARGAGRPRARRSARAIIAQAGPSSVWDAEQPDVVFAASARLHNAADLAAARGEGDATIIRRQFESRGDAGLAQLLGAFAFAHWDETAGRLTLGRDCQGERPLFFHVGEGFAAFASYLPDLLALPDVPRRLDETMMANFLALNHREYERTFYAGIDRAPTRTRVTINRDGVRMRRYWSPRLDAPAPFKRDEDYIDRARELFDRAVARCLKDTPRVAILTSGGLDSSAAAATAARLGHSDVTCYTGVPPEGFVGPSGVAKYLDERPKVEALGRMHPTLRMRLIAPKGPHPLQHDGSRLFASLGLPMRNAAGMGWLWALDDAIQKDGHSVVLTGTAGNGGLTWSGRDSLRALAARGRFGAVFREIRAMAQTDKRPAWRILAAEMERMAPGAIRDLLARLRGARPSDIFRYSPLRPEAVEALNLYRHWREDGFEPWRPRFKAAGRVRTEMLFDQAQAGRDAQAMSPLWRGFEYRDPHADRELLEFCLAVPEPLYRRDGVERWFGRQVFADRLPPDILDEQRRGQQASNWFDALGARKDSLVGEIDRIESSPLAARLIDTPRLRRLCEDWPKSVDDAQARHQDYRAALSRAVHVAQFIRWVEGGNG